MFSTHRRLLLLSPSSPLRSTSARLYGCSSSHISRPQYAPTNTPSARTHSTFGLQVSLTSYPFQCEPNPTNIAAYDQRRISPDSCLVAQLTWRSSSLITASPDEPLKLRLEHRPRAEMELVLHVRSAAHITCLRPPNTTVSPHPKFRNPRLHSTATTG